MSIGYGNICSSVHDHRQKFSMSYLRIVSGRINESNGINRRKLEVLKSRSSKDKRSRRSRRHQKHSPHQKLVHQKLTSLEVLKKIRSWKIKAFQMLFKWWFNHAYHCRRLEESSNVYFKRIWRHWMLILWRTLKKDICTKCTTTISTGNGFEIAPS